MKYAIIIPDGAADMPLDALDGKTPFETAWTPHIDRLAVGGRMGTAATTPEGMTCGSDVCSMSLLGYDPRVYHTGRAPLEAAALGIDLDPADWVFRVNFVTVIDGLMEDHSAGHISSKEGQQLLTALADRLDLPGVTLYPGVSYRNVMVDRGHNCGNARDWEELVTVPPHDIPGEPIRKHLPVGGEFAPLLQRMIAESEVCFSEHEVNLTRKEMGELPATHVWPWGQGRRPNMPGFEERFGLRGAMITAVDLLAGIAEFIGWDRLDVAGQTSYHDTDYAAAGRGAVGALADYDIVCVHVEAPDEASHAADAATKVAAIEAIDEHVVGPVWEALESGVQSPESGVGEQKSEDRRQESEVRGQSAEVRGQETPGLWAQDSGPSDSGSSTSGLTDSGLTDSPPWRLLLLPDHYTRVANRKHDPTPVPFLMAGHKVRAVRERSFTEKNANESDLHIPYGHELMEYFLTSGV